MPGTGFTPIQLFHSSTSGTLPTTSQLFTGEVFWNIADNKVYGLNTAGSALQTIVGSLGNQNANTVAITGGSINGTTIGATTPSTGVFTTLVANTSVLSPIVGAGTGSNLSLQANATTWATLTTSGYFGIGTTSPNYTFNAFTTSTYIGGWGIVGEFGATNYPMINLNAVTPNKISRIGNNGDGSIYLFVNGSSTTLGTQALTLFSSGGLSLGNTTDPGAGNLSVSGTVIAGELATTQTPTASTTASNYSVPIILNGTTYYIRLSSTA